MNYSRRIAKLEALYRLLPDLRCKGLCQQSCGPVAMSRLEHERIRNDFGRDVIPMETVHATLSRSVIELEIYQDPAALDCPALTKEGRCGIYNARPLVCRVWGMTPQMPCPHGCEPTAPLSDDRAGELIAMAESL